jgi:hypothetical protein
MTKRSSSSTSTNSNSNISNSNSNIYNTINTSILLRADPLPLLVREITPIYPPPHPHPPPVILRKNRSKQRKPFAPGKEIITTPYKQHFLLSSIFGPPSPHHIVCRLISLLGFDLLFSHGTNGPKRRKKG